MRLTKKLNPPYEQILGEDYVYTSETRLTKSFAQVEQKLGQLEDIEEELGIDLITLFKALKNGIVLANEKPRKRPCQLRMFYEKPMLVVDYGDGTCSEVYVAGYKNSWALTKEELL